MKLALGGSPILHPSARVHLRRLLQLCPIQGPGLLNLCARTPGTFPDMQQQETPSRSLALVGVTKPSLSCELKDVSEGARTLLYVEALLGFEVRVLRVATLPLLALADRVG